MIRAPRGDFFARYPDRYQAQFDVGGSNPAVRDRVNCVNAKLLNQAGQMRVIIDPKCKQLIQDLERVHWKADTHGNPLNEIDKSDPARTHVSDALGYMLAREFSMNRPGGFRPERLC